MFAWHAFGSMQLAELGCKRSERPHISGVSLSLRAQKQNLLRAFTNLRKGPLLPGSGRCHRRAACSERGSGQLQDALLVITKLQRIKLLNISRRRTDGLAFSAQPQGSTTDARRQAGHIPWFTLIYPFGVASETYKTGAGASG